MMGIGELILLLLGPLMEFLAPIIPGEIFPYFFEWEIFQRSLISITLVTIVAGMLGVFLIIQNLSLIGDGLAHVSFGGIAIALVLGATSPMWWALMFSIIASLIIYEFQTRDILTGDASIAIFLTGMLALGLVALRLGGGAITADIEGYLFGSVLLIDTDGLNMIATICVVAMIIMAIIGSCLLYTSPSPRDRTRSRMPSSA